MCIARITAAGALITVPTKVLSRLMPSKIVSQSRSDAIEVPVSPTSPAAIGSSES